MNSCLLYLSIVILFNTVVCLCQRSRCVNELSLLNESEITDCLCSETSLCQQVGVEGYGVVKACKRTWGGDA